MIDYADIYTLHQKLVNTKPVVLNLTNSVTQDFMANVLLALGTAPIMSSSIDEVPELVSISGAININIGTLDNQFINIAKYAAKDANAKNKPVILDPVGAGASQIRTDSAIELSQYANIIRGNSSEIMALVRNDVVTHGVESSRQSQDAIESAKSLANKHKSILAISGKTDYIIGIDRVSESSFGTELMTKVTGMGCALGAVIAAFAAVERDYFLATNIAIAFYTLVAEDAERRADKPAKFRTEFIDSLFAPDWDFINDRLERLNNHVS